MCHNNGVRTDNRVDNLRWDTPKANSQDRIKHGNVAQSNRTVCPRKHALRAPNLVASKRGIRTCLACGQAKAFISFRRRGGYEYPDLQTESDLRYEMIMSGAYQPGRRIRRLPLVRAAAA